MLPHKNRLTKGSDFNMVYKSGRFFYFGDIILAARKNDLEETRIGIVVGTKFSKKAVDRNRAKRQLREIIREIFPNLIQGMDLVVMIKKDKRGENKKTDFTSQEWEYSLLGALKKAKLIKL